MGLLGSDDRATQHERSAAVAYRLAPPSWPRRATCRSIHLEPLTDLGHIGKPESANLPEVPVRLLMAEVTLDAVVSVGRWRRSCCFWSIG